jgi:hypothetical protein
MQDSISERPARTYAMCWVCKRRSTDRSKFYSDPFAPVLGVAYRCPDHEACSERRRNREADAAERRQAKREAAEAERAELAEPERSQCTAETATRYCVLGAGHDGPHVDGIATWNDQPAAEPSPIERQAAPSTPPWLTTSARRSATAGMGSCAAQ